MVLTSEERDALLFEHMEYAEKEAAKFLRSIKRALTTERLIGAAYTGLVLATRTYDPSRGEPFIDHAWRWVLDYLARQFQQEWRAQSNGKYAASKQGDLFDNAITTAHNTMLAQLGAITVLECEDISTERAVPVKVQHNDRRMLEAVRDSLDLVSPCQDMAAHDIA